MKGTWGRRVYGSVIKGAKYTRFHLEVRLDNGVLTQCNIIQSNHDLERFPDLYGFVLDRMTKEIDQRIHERFQEWMRE